MTILSNYVCDANEIIPDAYENVLAGDLAIAAGVYTTGATLVLPAGTWNISAQASVLNGAIGAGFVNSKITVGAVDYAPTEKSCIISGTAQVYTPQFTVLLPVTTTVLLRVTMDQIATLKATGVNGGAVGGTTWLKARRVH